MYKTTSVLLLALLANAGALLAQGESIDARPPKRPPQGQGPGQPPPTPEQWVARLDTDQDGKVSAEEFDGPPEHFTRFDRNGDGFLDASEAPTRGFIARLDSDQDGKVSAEEFDGPPEHFSHLDRNQDGFISAEEAPKGPPPGRRHRRLAKAAEPPENRSTISLV